MDQGTIGRICSSDAEPVPWHPFIDFGIPPEYRYPPDHVGPSSLIRSVWYNPLMDERRRWILPDLASALAWTEKRNITKIRCTLAQTGEYARTAEEARGPGGLGLPSPQASRLGRAGLQRHDGGVVGGGHLGSGRQASCAVAAAVWWHGLVRGWL